MPPPTTPLGPVQISPHVHWIGALDPGLRSFDIVLRTPNGTTYNSYLVRGAEGVAVVDTVKAACAEQFFARLEAVARYDEIRYVVLNHLEPDHTGALPELMRRAPQAQLLVSSAAKLMLKALLNLAELPSTPVDTGDAVSLGDVNLEFFRTPYLHWPDTMCTWLPADSVLFSGDVFGCHHCDPRLFDDAAGDFRFAFDYYFAHIMRPFKRHVLPALDLLEPLAARVVAPAHGPILRDRPARYMALYRQWSTPHLSHGAADEKRLVLFYLSAYGNTRAMAEAISEGLAQEPGINVSVYDLEGSTIDPFVDLLEEADALLIGTPTINADAPKPVWDLLSSLARINVAGKLGATFGSFGWSGEAVKLVEERMRGLKLRVPVGGLRVKLVPDPKELEQCRAFGRDIAGHLLGRAEAKVIDMAELMAR